METVSIVIPSRNEKYLDVTLKDLLSKAQGKIEIIVVLEGYDCPRIDGVTYIHHPQATGMKYAINEAVALSTGKYVMKIDAHCIVAPGFDLQLIKDHQPNWIQIPRRYKLDEEKWAPDFTTFIDHEYWQWPGKYKPPSLHGYKWYARTQERKEIMLDDTLTFQGSFWFMTREHWDTHNFMKDEGYNELHAQEAAYIGTATWLSGGRVVTNKNTWYAHLHKQKGTRGYHMDLEKRNACYEYSYKHWVHDNKEGFINLIEKFWPLPGWPSNWKQRIWN